MAQESETDFSLVLGGPLYQLFRRMRMLQPPLELHRRRIIGLSLFAWLPLLVLSILEGNALSGLAVPFLQDVEVQARFLIALPLLIVTELVVHQRLAPAVRQFVERSIVRDSDRPRFDAIVASTMRWRNSIAWESFLLAFVITGGHYFWSEQHALSGETWYARPASAGLGLSLAGQWYAWVSVPLFQFLWLRWYYRIVLWFGLLWRVSQLDLHLVPTHPDRAGGLGFLAASTTGFAPLLAAQSTVIAGMIFGRILHEGARLKSFQPEIAGTLVISLAFVLGPLCVFIPSLLAAKRQGAREYGLLANRYVREFDAKWIRGGAPAAEPLVGSADIQSLADLTNSYDVIQKMRPVPFSRETVLQLAVTAALPLLPLVLTEVPLQQLLERLFGTLL